MRRVGPPALVALWCGLAAAAPPAQVLKQERRTYARVQELRAQVLAEWHGADAARRAAAAAALLGDMRGDPFLPLAEALAALRGVRADDAFRFRLGVQCFALPEVLDRDAIANLSITMHTPVRIEIGQSVSFRVRIRDAKGGEVWTGAIERDTGPEDLAYYRATVDVPAAGFADGSYRVEVDACLADQEPRATDPAIGATVHVLRGFKARAEKVLGAAAEERDDRELKALVQGVAAPVARVYQGEAPWSARSPVRDLEVAERVLANVAAGRAPLAGVRGRVDLMVPLAGGDALPLDLRLPAGADAVGLVVGVAGVPRYDAVWSRPTAPTATPGGWLADLLEASELAVDPTLALASLESPGRVADAGAALRAAVHTLRRWLAFPAGAVVVLGEREGAAVALTAALDEPGLIRGVGLVGGGSLSSAELARLATVPILAVPTAGAPGRENLLRLARLAESRPAGAEVRLLDLDPLPWPLGLPLALPELGPRVRAWLRAPAASRPQDR
ncbi:MAG: hypothetical protein IT458_06175 [Planctomycetes bacterium]|nr:hypothetical protein [Planctomycetota bacterium]